ncbi:MAG: M18 family aminopeptidase [Erysipelotrichaceae bacterium]|nr:M18 family aminopeptidase [Erysipelotrichaceae bacterium]
MHKKVSKELLAFLQKSPSCFHAIRAMKEELENAGFEELLEGSSWSLAAGKFYYVVRNGSSIIAFKIGKMIEDYSFNIVASHSDSPCFKIKENAELEVKGKYAKLNTEGYGGMLCSTWLDRPLSIAGRVIVKKDNTYETRLVNIDRDLLLIPNVAIHMNRQVNNGFAYNLQVDTIPLFSTDTKDNLYKQLLAKELDVAMEDIYGSDLYLYNRTHPSIWGANQEFISSPRLDDLQCAFSSLKALLDSSQDKSINVYCCFDNEEVGSGTKQGAASTFLYDTLQRINTALGKSQEEYYRAIASSFMISADNAHAVHPNHPEKTDEKNCVYMNEGIVIKFSANQKYTTDAVSEALFKGYCEKANVPVQYFHNRSDVAGGSTLGNISSTKVSVNMVDIGLAQLAMHSSYETAGIKDTLYLINVLKEFYSSHVKENASGSLSVIK